MCARACFSAAFRLQLIGENLVQMSFELCEQWRNHMELHLLSSDLCHVYVEINWMRSHATCVGKLKSELFIPHVISTHTGICQLGGMCFQSKTGLGTEWNSLSNRMNASEEIFGSLSMRQINVIILHWQYCRIAFKNEYEQSA